MRPNNWFDIWAAVLCLATAFLLVRWARPLPRVMRRLTFAALFIAVSSVCAGALVGQIRFAYYVPYGLYPWIRGLGIVSACVLLYTFLVVLSLRGLSNFQPQRRKLLRLAGAAAVAAPVVASVAAFIRREDLRLAEVELKIPGLAPDLNGLRIVQISDIHLSPLVSENLLKRAVGMANEARASLAVVTGDLITLRGDPLDLCLQHLSRVRTDAGTFGCMGNHEAYADAESYTTSAGLAKGIRFLRGESQELRFGNSILNLAGVDYQRKARPYLRNAEKLRKSGALNVLLSHNPDVFPVAAAKGFDITLAGHTHGGQVTFEMLHPTLNIARFVTPYVQGVYQRGSAQIYVTRGVGLIGVPARLGAMPEVSVIRLCAI